MLNKPVRISVTCKRGAGMSMSAVDYMLLKKFFDIRLKNRESLLLKVKQKEYGSSPGQIGNLTDKPLKKGDAN